MHRHIFKVFLLCTAVIAFATVKAQNTAICKGSLGDPVINETFGAGANPGNPFPFVDMNYTTGCPNDGQYTVVNTTLINNSNCHPDTWHAVTSDHTGDPNGYMMLINASYAPSVFYKQQTEAKLCQNTTYEFSAYVLNMFKLSASDDKVVHPNVKYTIKAPDGTVLKTQTDSVPPTDSPEWHRFSMFFTTPANINQVIIELSNKASGGIGNDLLLDDIQFRACGPVIRAGFTTITANQPQNQCIGETKNYTLKAAVGDGYNSPRLQWQLDKSDGNGWIDIAGQTTDTYNVSVTGTALNVYQYRIAAAEAANIGSPDCRVYSDPLSVTINAYPQVPQISQQSACEGDVLSIPAAGGVSYEWHGPSITAANINQNPLVLKSATVADQGYYYVNVTSAGNCITRSNTFTVSVNAKPVITVSPSPTICQGTSTVLNAASPTAVAYKWSPIAGLSDPASATPVARPVVTTTYTVIVTTAKGCSDSAKVVVNVLPPPVANAGAPKKIFEGQSVTLNATATNADTYTWTPVTGLSDPAILNPVASPTDDITYTLHVQSVYNCGTDSSSVFVRVYKKLIIPNTFSPNGDGKNDFWNIEALVTYPQSLLTVFNRYGELVFKTTGYEKPWRGTFNGSLLPNATYYYMIDLKNGAPVLSGWVLLIK